MNKPIQIQFGAGSLLVVYCDDGQGRRIVLAKQSAGMAQTVGLIGATKADVKKAAKALMELAEELPDEPGRPIPLRATPVCGRRGGRGSYFTMDRDYGPCECRGL